MPSLTPTDLRARLAEHDLAPRRALGQHFLADPNTARRIVRLAELEPGASVLEIGPGLGSLTVALVDAGARVRAVELDGDLVPALRETLAGLERVTVVRGDALTIDLSFLDGGRWACVSNLPYNVATPIVLRLLEHAPTVTRLVVMVQREVGERLAAPPGHPAAGAASVKVAYHAAARVLGVVPRSVFIPAPGVDSVLVRLDRRPSPPVAVPSAAVLFALARTGFAHRRKMLRRALRPELGPRTEAVLAEAGIDPRRRAESLRLDEWADLTRVVGAVE